jgi:hypothetical protein
MASLAAEGSSNPYWSPEAEESPRIARILTVLKRQHDAARIAFFVGKSNNDNFVAYRWDSDKAALTPFWISTVNVPSERRDPLNLAESMLYGVEMNVTDRGEWIVNIAAEGLRNRVMNLNLDENDQPALTGVINGHMCVIEYAYVQMCKGLLPDVDWVRITGRDLRTQEIRSEVLRNPK